MRPEDYFNNCIGVFQGGGCKAIAYLGAYKKAHELGIMFSEVAGTSAGSIIAAMIAVGCPPEKLEDLIKKTNFKKLAVRATTDNYWLTGFIIDCLTTILAASLVVIVVGLYSLYFIFQSCKILIIRVYRKIIGKACPYFARKWPLFPLFTIYSSLFLTISSLFHGRWGVFNSKMIQDKIEEWFEFCGVKREITFEELSIQLHIVSTDVFRRQAKIWNSKKTPNVKISKAVAASCSIPLFFTPVAKKYVDGGIISNRPDFLFNETENEHKFTKILSFSLESSSKHYHTQFEFFSQLVNTIIDGSDKLQHEMLPRLLDKIIIQHGDIEATSFNKINVNKIDELISYGEEAVDHFLKTRTEDGLKHLICQSRGIISSRERLYTQVASWSFVSPKKVIIYEPNLDWVWSLFPTLISWINSGAKIIIYRQDHEWEKHKKARCKDIKKLYNCDITVAKQKLAERIIIRNSRERLLNTLGCKVNPYRFNRIKGFFFEFSNNQFIGIGIQYPEDYNQVYAENQIRAKIYTDTVDSALLSEQIKALKVNEDFIKMPVPGRCSIIQNEAIRAEIENRLRTISFYANAYFSWEEINIEDLTFLNSRLRGFKYTQDMHIFELFKDKTLFDGSAILLQNNKLSYMAPIIIEEHHQKLYVIKGNTRCLYAWRHGYKVLTVLIIRGVESPLPVEGDPIEFKIDNLFVSEDTISGQSRYGNKFQKDLFRPIEEKLRPYNSYLL